MPDEPRLTISSSPLVNPEDVARHDFATVRKGFDAHEVRAYLESLANVMRSFAEREHQLLEALADAEHRAANPVLDEPTLTAALGTETARVLHSAHEVANDMVTKAETDADRTVSEADAHAERVVTEADAEAARMVVEARTEADRLVAEATASTTESRTRTEAWVAERTQAADAAAEDTVERARQKADALVGGAEREAQELRDAARDEGRAMVEEAQQVRARVLADLARKRRAFHAQIEQLRAGRERLAETINDVRGSVDTIVQELFTAEDDARQAAEAAGRELQERGDDPTPDDVLEAELASVTGASSGGGTGAGARGGARTPSMTVAAATARESAPSALADPDPDAPTGDAGAGDPDTGDSAVDAMPPAQEPAVEVDALFAKIRAGSVASPRDEPAGEGGPDTAGGEVVPAASSARKSRSKAKRAAPARTAAASATATAAAEQDVPEATDEAGDDADGPPDPRHPLAARRDGLVDPIVTKLSRKLKRTLQDGQNELLDAVRSAKDPHWSPDVLPDETEQVDAIATAALPALEDAALAGAGFVRPDGTTLPSTDNLLAIAHELAESIATPLRRRLVGDGAFDDGDVQAVTEHVGAAFREWKGERIDRIAGDHVIAAFSAGTVAALEGEADAAVEWLAVAADGAEAPCPDCEDNGLNGAQRAGEKYPTGHLHPPAHPGCRCLLVSTSG